MLRLNADAFGDLDERVGHRPAQRVPLVDATARLRAQSLGIRAGVIRIVDPRLDLRERDLRVELHRPRALAQAKRLRADVVARKLDRSVGHAERVVVPLERIERTR